MSELKVTGHTNCPYCMGTGKLMTVEEVHMIGKYRADYSGLTEAEIALAQPPELEELYRNSTPVNRRT